MVNSQRIKNRLYELKLTQKDAAIAMNVAQPTACQKINNLRPMDLEEAEKLSNLLNIDSADFGSYFFYSNGCTVQPA